MGESFRAAYDLVLQGLIDYVPRVLAAVGLLILGWILARIARTITRRVVRILEASIARVLPWSGVEPPRFGPESGRVAGDVVFWITLLFFFTAAIHFLGIAAFSTWLDRALEHLPAVVAGVIIVAGGHILARVSRDLVTATSVGLGEAQAIFLGTLTQVAVFSTAIVVGADQMGIKVDFLIYVGAIVVAALVGGVALAVSLGAAGHVSNLIGAHQMRKSHSVGQIVRIADHEGKILEINSSSLVLETDQGRVTLPAKMFSDHPTVLLAGTGGAEGRNE